MDHADLDVVAVVTVASAASRVPDDEVSSFPEPGLAVSDATRQFFVRILTSLREYIDGEVFRSVALLSAGDEFVREFLRVFAVIQQDTRTAPFDVADVADADAVIAVSVAVDGE